MSLARAWPPMSLADYAAAPLARNLVSARATGLAPSSASLLSDPGAFLARVPRLHWQAMKRRARRVMIRAAAVGALRVRSLLVLLGACGIWVTTGCDSAADISKTTRGGRTTSHNWMMEYGIRDQELVFLVIVGRSLSAQVEGIVSEAHVGDADVSFRIGRPGARAGFVLKKPDGQMVDILATGQLFEVIDGQYRQSTERITLNEWNTFQNSAPEHWGIQSLLEFVEALRRKDPVPKGKQ